MFKKKGMEAVLSDIKKYFTYLFDGRFRIVATKYEREIFGNWIVVLHSQECGIRFYQDRRQIFIMVAPPWAPANLEKMDHYFDLEFYIAFLEGSESVQSEANLQHIELQYEEMSRKLLTYYDQIVQLVNQPDFANVENELFQLRERVHTKQFSGLFGKKS